MNARLPLGLSQYLSAKTRNQGCPFALTLAFALALITNSATAVAEFTIQVGAFKNPSEAFANQVREYGEVNTAQSGNDITVFMVGRFDTLAQANNGLAQVRSAYPSAFVRNMPAAARRATAQPNTASAANTAAAETSTPDTQLWAALSDDERRRVVYLDGVLHLKQGDQFIPLTEYHQAQTR